jgi:hypothetical protein
VAVGATTVAGAEISVVGSAGASVGVVVGHVSSGTGVGDGTADGDDSPTSWVVPSVPVDEVDVAVSVLGACASVAVVEDEGSAQASSVGAVVGTCTGGDDSAAVVEPAAVAPLASVASPSTGAGVAEAVGDSAGAADDSALGVGVGSGDALPAGTGSLPAGASAEGGLGIGVGDGAATPLASWPGGLIGSETAGGPGGSTEIGGASVVAEAGTVVATVIAIAAAIEATIRSGRGPTAFRRVARGIDGNTRIPPLLIRPAQCTDAVLGPEVYARRCALNRSKICSVRSCLTTGVLLPDGCHAS